MGGVETVGIEGAHQRNASAEVGEYGHEEHVALAAGAGGYDAAPDQRRELVVNPLGKQGCMTHQIILVGFFSHGGGSIRVHVDPWTQIGMVVAPVHRAAIFAVRELAHHAEGAVFQPFKVVRIEPPPADVASQTEQNIVPLTLLKLVFPEKIRQKSFGVTEGDITAVVVGIFGDSEGPETGVSGSIISRISGSITGRVFGSRSAGIPCGSAVEPVILGRVGSRGRLIQERIVSFLVGKGEGLGRQISLRIIGREREAAEILALHVAGMSGNLFKGVRHDLIGPAVDIGMYHTDADEDAEAGSGDSDMTGCHPGNFLQPGKGIPEHVGRHLVHVEHGIAGAVGETLGITSAQAVSGRYECRQLFLDGGSFLFLSFGHQPAVVLHFIFPLSVADILDPGRQFHEGVSLRVEDAREYGHQIVFHLSKFKVE